MSGGFVASSGLESYHAHGLLKPGADGLLYFIRLSLEAYANQSAAFVLDTHHLITNHVRSIHHLDSKDDAKLLDKRKSLLQSISRLEGYYQTMTLNHVAQRASKAQGIALLTLFLKSFSEESAVGEEARSKKGFRNGQECNLVIKQLKSAIRSNSFHGHFPLCWAAFTACMGIAAKRSLQVHLFLQVRAIISSAIRLNIVGPYLAHRLLAFNAKDIIDDILKVVDQSSTGIVVALEKDNVFSSSEQDVNEDEEQDGWNWTWSEDINHNVSVNNNHHTPKMTWPLGDLVQARHDQLHSRLFNS